MSDSDWHGNEPHQCCEDSFNLDGAHGSEANFQAEWWYLLLGMTSTGRVLS